MAVQRLELDFPWKSVNRLWKNGVCGCLAIRFPWRYLGKDIMRHGIVYWQSHEQLYTLLKLEMTLFGVISFKRRKCTVNTRE